MEKEDTPEKEGPARHENFECPVCYENFNDAHMVTVCGHSFCKGCVDEVRDHHWLLVDAERRKDGLPKTSTWAGDARGPQCPTCRREFAKSEVCVNIALRSLTQDLDKMREWKDEMRELRQIAQEAEKEKNMHSNINDALHLQIAAKDTEMELLIGKLEQLQLEMAKGLSTAAADPVAVKKGQKEEPAVQEKSRSGGDLDIFGLPLLPSGDYDLDDLSSSDEEMKQKGKMVTKAVKVETKAVKTTTTTTTATRTTTTSAGGEGRRGSTTCTTGFDDEEFPKTQFGGSEPFAAVATAARTTTPFVRDSKTLGVTASAVARAPRRRLPRISPKPGSMAGSSSDTIILAKPTPHQRLLSRAIEAGLQGEHS